MFRRTIFSLLFSLINFSVSGGHWIYLRTAVQPRIINDINEISNETESSLKLLENNITSTTENDILFWTIPDTKDAVEADSEMQLDANTLATEPANDNSTLPALEDTTEVEMNEMTSISTSQAETLHDNPKPEKNQSNDISDNDLPDSVMNEKIILQRNNCHLEIAIQENHDLKIEIQFVKLQNNTSGKCYITLNGQENTMLGLFISNIYLYQNGSEGELLKVIIADYGSDFILKEYYSETKYQPLLLTETHKVYIVLYYKVGSVRPNQQNSHFNLEVFSYHKYENYIHHGNSYTESHFPYQNDVQNLPINETPFVPYYNF